MKRVKKMLCLLLALVMVGGTILPNIKAKAENAGVVDKSTIDRIEVWFEGTLLEDDLTTVYETGLDGQEISFTGYSIQTLTPHVTVHYNNGTQPDVYDEWRFIYNDMVNKFGEMPVFRTMQYEEAYNVGQNTVDVSFLNEQFKCEAAVMIVANPVKEIQVVTTKPLYENKNMYSLNGTYNGEWVSWKEYNLEFAQPVITVIEKDGDVVEFSGIDELSDEYGYRGHYSSDQSYTNHWTVGKHKVTLNFMAKTCEFEVELQENPVKHIEVKYHGVVIEDVTTQLDPYKMEFVFTFANGSEETFYCYNTVFGDQIAPNFQKAEGAPEGKQRWIGYVCEQEVILETDVMKISDAPIKAISVVATNDLVASWHQCYDWQTGEEVLDPFATKPEVTLTYQDGSQLTMGYFEMQSKFPEVEAELSLDNNSLEGIGQRTAKLKFYGFEEDFTVNVIENPVERISVVTTKPLIEGYRGDMYDLTFDGGVIITVYYKDGGTVSGTVDELNELLYAYPQEEHKEVVIGKNVKEYTFLDRTCDVEFEVVPETNPVVSIDAKLRDNAVIYKKQDSPYKAHYGYDHLVDVTITYKDGTKLTGTIGEVNEQLDKKMKVVDQIWIQDDQWEREWGLGTHQGFVTYRDMSAPIEVKVVENPYVKATISNEDGFTVVLEKKDGQIETYKAKRYVSAGSYGDNWNVQGYLETDKGTLPIETKFAGGLRKDYTNIFYMFVHGIKSNSLENCKWMEQQSITKAYGDVPSVQLNNSAEELRELVLMEKDYENVSVEGVNAWLEISNKEGDISAEEQNLLNKATDEIDGYQNGVVVDLTVYKQFGDSGETLNKEKVPNLNDKISITMQVPEDVLASTTDPSTIKMVRIHNGETQVLPCVYDAATKTITFETDKFSTYAMAYEAPASQGGTASGSTASQPSNTNDSKTQDSAAAQTAQPSPKTGDHNRMFVYFLLCAASLMVLATGKKKEY